jgi:integron integrase
MSDASERIKRFLDGVRAVIRAKHYSWKTEKTYLNYITQYLAYYKWQKHPRELREDDISRFLTHLAVNKRLSATAQNQAFYSILFLYKHVLKIELANIKGVVRAKKPKRLPAVLSQEETLRLLANMEGQMWLQAQIMYGAGLRVNECLDLRVKDLDFDKKQFTVRCGKGGKDRVTVMPELIIDPLKVQLDRTKRLFTRWLKQGKADVYLPHALAKKYPRMPTDWAWQFVFPSRSLCTDRFTGKRVRYHMHESNIQLAIRKAKSRAGILKHVGPHTLRHCFATHLLENNVNIRIVQELMGHSNVETTMVYTHVMDKGTQGIPSPTDVLHQRTGPM